MKACYVTSLDAEEWLDNLAVGELPDPEPAPGMSRIRVTRSSLNHHDIWTLRGVSSQPIVPPQILGCDAVGIIEGYGEGAVAPYPVGTRVIVYSGRSCGTCDACRFGTPEYCKLVGMLSEQPHQGAFAELLNVPTSALIALPDSVSDDMAACLPTAYLTAYQMLFEKASVHPGMSVLVQGATGGVASAAILLAKRAGATVIATSRTAEGRAFALELGADAAAPAAKGELPEALESVGCSGGVDVVIETVGEATWEFSLRSVRPGGMVVVSGATTGGNPPSRLNRVFWFQLAIQGSTGGKSRDLARLVQLVAHGGFTPRIDSVVALDDIRSGFERLGKGEQHGKIVVAIGAN